MLSLLSLLHGTRSSTWRLFEHHLLSGRLLRALAGNVPHCKRCTRVSMV
jgi:hypothetical protein